MNNRNGSGRTNMRAPTYSTFEAFRAEWEPYKCLVRTVTKSVPNIVFIGLQTEDGSKTGYLLEVEEAQRIASQISEAALQASKMGGGK